MDINTRFGDTTQNKREQRDQYLRAVNAQVEEQEKAAATQKSSGPPPADAVETVTVYGSRKPTYEEALAMGKQGELDFGKQLLKDVPRSVTANLLGLPADIYNLLNVEKFTGNEDIQTATSDNFKQLFGLDPNSAGSVAGDFIDFPVGGLKAAAGVAGAVAKAGIFVPYYLVKDAAEAGEAGKIASDIQNATGMRNMTTGSPEWLAANKDIFGQTKGYFFDLSNRLRKYIPTPAGNLNPRLRFTTAGADIGPYAKLESVINPDIWDHFDPAVADYLKKIPVFELIHKTAGGQWGSEKGIGMNIQRIGNNPEQFANILEHELEHVMQFLSGSGRGGSINRKDKAYVAAADAKEDAFTKAKEYLENEGYTKTAIDNVLGKLRYLGNKFATDGRQALEDSGSRELASYANRYENIPELQNFVEATSRHGQEEIRITEEYMTLSGEIMARTAEIARKEGLPFDEMMARGWEKLRVPKNVRKGEGGSRPLTDLPQSNLGVVTAGAYSEGLSASDIASGKYDDELKKLIAEQAADQKQVGSNFRKEGQREELAAVRKEAGVTNVKAERPTERINETFPPQPKVIIEGNPKDPTSTRQQMTIPDSQGAKLDDVRGGEPSGFPQYGNILEGARELAVGKERVWASGKFDVEAFKNSVESFKRDRTLELSKGNPKKSLAEQNTAPKFWAYDESTGKVLVVQMGEDGKLAVSGKTGKFQLNDATRDKVDIFVKDRKGLDEFIASVVEKGTPKRRHIGPVNAETKVEDMTTEQLIRYINSRTDVSRQTLLENLTPQERTDYLTNF